ncbi:mitochondrial 39-S ribosomal protein L47 (MRP-L47)-domain-containing protein, partial [Dipodascopsis uninucleata]
ANRAKYLAERHEAVLRKPRQQIYRVGEIGKDIKVLVTPKKGEQWDLQPRPPITPAPEMEEWKTSQSHPLWGFFRDGVATGERQSITTFREYEQAGRAWAIADLRRKSFEDLHTLWYVCLKELNIVLTEKYALRKLARDASDAVEAQMSDVIEKLDASMANIKTVLIERRVAWAKAGQEFDMKRFITGFP